MGLLPLAWLVGLRAAKQQRGAAWWWLAGALGVSWLADTAATWVNADLVGNLYPISQSALVGAVLLDREDAKRLVIVLGAVGVVAVTWRGPLGVDVLLSTVANGAAAGIAWKYRAIGRVRLSLLIYFGGAGLVWLVYGARIGYCAKLIPCLYDPATINLWMFYQAVRALGIGAFCWASLSVTPKFRLSS